MSDTPTPETDEINLLLENLDEWIDDSLQNSKPIGLTLCSARRTILDQRARITELWDALGMVSRQRDRFEEQLNDAWKERDEARRELDELRKKLDDSDAVMNWSASKVEELNKSLIRLVTERNQAREIARLAFYIIRGVDPKFVKLAYERSVYWNGQEQPIQFMRDAIKSWDKEKKEEAK